MKRNVAGVIQGYGVKIVGAGFAGPLFRASRPRPYNEGYANVALLPRLCFGGRWFAGCNCSSNNLYHY
jgi:hypothetical protein